MTFSRPFQYLRQYADAACDVAAGDNTVATLAAQLAMIKPWATATDRDLLYAADIHLFLRNADEVHPDPLPWAVYAYRSAQDLNQGRGRDFQSTLHRSLADAGHLTGHRLICAYRPSATAVHSEPRDVP
jgi:hypothetical protein